ncbi:hypothetical protein ACIRS1_29450 [Kitasatospora sp. NPDC101176]|uniref:hypothetical protein n=1 Tax=Kitasatospora sp. NPDC101176 TaxID=3364099 RepID=UPI00382C0179
MTSRRTGTSTLERRPNWQLADLLDQAGLSNKQFARSVRETAVRHGHDAKCTHTSVQRWLDGRSSRAVPPELIAETLSLALGRLVSTTDIGMPTNRHRDLLATMTEFIDEPADLVAAARRLWSSDLDQHSAIRVEIPAGALSGPALHWLLAPAPPPPPGRGAGPLVTAADVTRVHTTCRTFDQIAGRHGGAAARLPAVQYLHTGLSPLLTGRYPGPVGRLLFGATAEACLGIGRYAFDEGLYGLARRYQLLALFMAHHADDRLVGAHALAALADQSLTVGDHPPTMDLVRAALTATVGHDPYARAALHASEARAYAARRDPAATARALAEVRRCLGRAAQPAPEPHGPDRTGGFGPADLADCELRCRLALGDHRAARDCARLAIAARDPGRVVDQAIGYGLLALAEAGSGRPDEACQAAEQALRHADGVQSAQVAGVLDHLADRLDRLDRTDRLDRPDQGSAPTRAGAVAQRIRAALRSGQYAGSARRP